MDLPPEAFYATIARLGLIWASLPCGEVWPRQDRTRAEEREISGRIRNQEIAMGTAGEELPGRVPSFSMEARNALAGG